MIIKNIILTVLLFSQIGIPTTLEGKKIVDTRIRMVDGEYAKLSDFHRDGPMIINFWTTWWTYCERQLGYLDQLSEEFKDIGLQVLAVNVNKANIINQVRPYIKKRKYKFNVSVDPSSKLAKQFKVRGFPTFLLIDKEGNVIDKSSGYEEGMENKYLSKLLKYFDSQNIKYKSFKYAETENGINENGNVKIDF